MLKQSPGFVVVRANPQSFSGAFGRDRLLSMPIDSIDAGLDRESTLASICDISNEQMCRAVAGLLHFLSNPLSDEARARADTCQVKSIEPYVPQDCVFLDQEAPRAMSLFRELRHPSAHGLGPSKEGISMFGLLDHCSSPLGKARLRSLLLRPSNKRLEIEERLAALSFLIDVNKHEWVQHVISWLKHLRSDARKLIRRVGGLEASVADWRAMAQLAAVGLKLRDSALVAEDSPEVALLVQLRSLDVSALEEVVALIDGTIDFVESERAGRVCLVRGVDAALDHLRQQYESLPLLLDSIAVQLAPNVPTTAGVRCVFFPQTGFMVAIARDPEHPVEAQWHIDGLEYRFHSQMYLYFKNDAVMELDQQLHDTYHEMIDCEMSLVRILADRVLTHANVLVECSTIAAELDCILSLAQASRNLGWTRPQIVDDGVLVAIEAGWNPLQEICAEHPLVPNDTNLDSHRVQIVTGPNGSGKSVYLKQVGLIVILAHIGCFVPARAARIGLLDAIFAHTSYLHSATSGAGALVKEIRSVSRGIRLGTAKSLLLLDEFGRGTNTLDGVSLVAGVLNHLLALGPGRCPRVLLASHLHELWEAGLIDHAAQHLYKIRQMQILLTQQQNSSSISFLFRVVDGAAKRSYAARVASAVGVPSHVVARAQDIANALYSRTPILSPHDGQVSELIDRALHALMNSSEPETFLKEIDFLAQ